MSVIRDLDRRTFLKLGTAGTALASRNPSIMVFVPPAQKRSPVPNPGRHGLGSADLPGIKVNSRLASFDPTARLEGLHYQGSLYTVTKDGAQRQKA